MSCGIGRRCGSDLALLWLWLADWTPNLGTSTYRGCGPNKTKDEKKKKKESNMMPVFLK